MTVPNVLATRYAGADLAEIWSPEHKIVLERRLWIAVLTAQKDLGVDVPDGVIEDYEAVVEKVDLESIAARERVTRHDVKARIEEFSALAGHEHIHKGMTSRDLTENVEQLQIRSSLVLIRTRVVAALARLARLATEHESLVMAGRSHNVAAQATTLGKRFATVADEMLVALDRLDDLLARYPLRGIKGPMGTPQDMLDLLDGSTASLGELEERVARHLGFERVLASVGQVYPRSLDFDVVSALVQLVAGPSNLATTIRLMAGIELVTEGFKEGQVGSSAMPHKMNTRSCERVNGLAVVLRGQLAMTGELAGDQWNEGDVSCSVVRRVALPDAFFAADGRPDVPHRARRVRRLPRGGAARARSLLAVPGDDQSADGRGPKRRRSRGGARGNQGTGGRGGTRDAPGPRRERPLPASRFRPETGPVGAADRSPGGGSDRVHRRRARPGRRRRRGVEEVVAADPEAAELPSRRDPLRPPVHCPKSRSMGLVTGLPVTSLDRAQALVGVPNLPGAPDQGPPPSGSGIVPCRLVLCLAVSMGDARSTSS